MTGAPLEASSGDADFPPIETLVPHAAPMILLDRIVARAPDRVTCELTVRPDAPFVEADGVAAVVALEYMAQAAAVFAGLRSVADGAPIRWGFLIGCSELNLEREVLHDYGNMSAPTVLFVLERLLERGLPAKTMMTAFGPGFTCAGMLLEAA